AYLPGEDTANWDYEGLLTEVRKLFPLPEDVVADDLEEQRRDEVVEYVADRARGIYERLEGLVTPDVMRAAERQYMIHIIDQHWIMHLTAIDDVREGIGLRAYGQRDPLVEYKVEAASMFDDLLDSIRRDVVRVVYHLTPRV